MKTQNTLLLAAAAVTVLNFQSCSKYEDGPAFSLRSKTSRLVGEWEVVKIDGQSVSRYIEESLASSFPSNYSFNLNNANITFEVDSDGDITQEMSYSVDVSYYSYYGYTYSQTFFYDERFDGEWEWEDNKESIEIDWDYGNNTEMEILRLTNDELIVETSDGIEYEFEKD